VKVGLESWSNGGQSPVLALTAWSGNLAETASPRKKQNLPGMFMPTAPLVSVIIPAYNAGRYLRLTLASVQGQTYRNLEILVVDDGSNDSTVQIVEEAARTDGRIRLIRQNNLGVAIARNTALAQARGEFVAPLDADDVWHPQNLAFQVAALQKAGPDVAVSYGWYVNIDENGEFCGTGPESQFERKQEVLSAQLKGNFIGNSSSTVMRRKAVEEVGGYEATLRARGAEGCEDQALYIALAKNWSFTFAPHYLIAYRRHPEAMSRDDERMALSQAFVLADLYRLRLRLPGNWFSRGIARIYEGQIIMAILQRRWSKVEEVIRRAGSISRWALVELLGFRVPIRILGFLARRLRNRVGLSQPERKTVRPFWLANTASTGEFSPNLQPSPDTPRSGI
jgi:glycosyltransferase involved in cell wall biosynthesis